MSWLTRLLGADGATQLAIDGTHDAARVSARPTEHGSLGWYSWGASTGILPAALGANSEIVQWRWASASNLCLVREIICSASVTTTMFAAGVPVELDLIKSVSWSVAGTGGNTPTFGTTCKLRTSTMGNSLIPVGDVRIATTAALGAGTKALETNPMSSLVAAGPITGSLNGMIIPPGTPLYRADVDNGEHPLVLAQNEGFSIRSVAVPATGTWRFAVRITWAEVASY